MKEWEKLLIYPTTSIIKALEIIDAGARQIAFVIDENQRLLGTVTDGDIRRGILKGRELTDHVQLVMNAYPTVATSYDTRENIIMLMNIKSIRQIPIIDEDGRIINVEIYNDLIQPKRRENIVVLMAGGLGTRLQPLTFDTPKPLLKVGNKPLLETILMNFIEHGFYRFYISVNYKAELIMNYLGDGTKWGVDIKYLQEEKKMGTAGPLSLLEENTDLPLLVMNGDLLTKVNFEQLLDFHNAHHAIGTICVREYDHQVPYGVVKLDKQRLIGIEEKPVQRFFVNAGIYVLDPSVLKLIPRNEYFDMPALFQKLTEQKEETIAFPIREYWMDIGRIADFEKANLEFSEVFG